MPAAADVELVASIQSGHSGAEAALYEKYAARVYYLALRESRLPHDAEDVRAETFLRVFQAIRGNHLRSAASLGAFILGKPRERDLLRLHYYEELPTQEIARRVGIAPERVRLVKSRALKHFREVYKRLGQATALKKLDTKGR